ncbi:MAG TPA: 3-hydroxyacyl-CoA dehydrogenase NAD-binding domain-containing protein [Gammaproteobacteria bacterium]
MAPNPVDGSNLPNWQLDRDDRGIAWLIFDKAGASTNVLSGHVMVELEEKLRELEQHPPKAVVVKSAKKSGFIAGADIKEFTGLESSAQAFDLIRRGQLVLDKLDHLPCPVVAAVHGFALGGGLELALACDYIVAADDPRTSLGLPEVNLGIHPGFGGTVRSIRKMGVVAAMELMLTGRAFNVKKAKATGLIDKAVPADQLDDAAAKLALNPPGKRSAPLPQKLLNLPGARHVFSKVLEKQVSAKARKDHYPAPYAIIDLWKDHIGNPAEMYLAEAHSIAKLMVGDTARNLVRVFLLQDRLKSLGNKKAFDLKHVHVVGAGTMGGDIAAWCAYKGFEVTLQDRELQYIDPAMKRARKLFEKKFKGNDAKVAEAWHRLKADVAGDGAKHADLVIEAIFENTEAKQNLYKDLKLKMKPDAVLATNTSSIRLEELATVLDDPNHLVGLHFFNPVAKMPLIEVIHSVDTDKDVMEKALAFARHVDRLPVPCKSSPGFLVNRILMPYLMEAMLLSEEGVANEAIDRAAKNFGMPMGPVELADTVGLDVCLSVAKILGKEFGHAVPKRLEAMVEAKKFGKKTGVGFYAYDENGKPKKDASNAQGGPADLQDRLIFPMLNEAVACLRENVVADADLLDAGVIFGTGFAPFRGGPMNFIKAQGPSRMRERQQALFERHGERFAPDAGWDSLSF